MKRFLAQRPLPSMMMATWVGAVAGAGVMRERTDLGSRRSRWQVAIRVAEPVDEGLKIDLVHP
jgi:hypothetical protein